MGVSIFRRKRVLFNMRIKQAWVICNKLLDTSRTFNTDDMEKVLFFLSRKNIGELHWVGWYRTYPILIRVELGWSITEITSHGQSWKTTVSGSNPMESNGFSYRSLPALWRLEQLRDQPSVPLTPRTLRQKEWALGSSSILAIWVHHATNVGKGMGISWEYHGNMGINHGENKNYLTNMGKNAQKRTPSDPRIKCKCVVQGMGGIFQFPIDHLYSGMIRLFLFIWLCYQIWEAHWKTKKCFVKLNHFTILWFHHWAVCKHLMSSAGSKNQQYHMMQLNFGKCNFPPGPYIYNLGVILPEIYGSRVKKEAQKLFYTFIHDFGMWKGRGAERTKIGGCCYPKCKDIFIYLNVYWCIRTMWW